MPRLAPRLQISVCCWLGLPDGDTEHFSIRSQMPTFCPKCASTTFSGQAGFPGALLKPSLSPPQPVIHKGLSMCPNVPLVHLLMATTHHSLSLGALRVKTKIFNMVYQSEVESTVRERTPNTNGLNKIAGIPGLATTSQTCQGLRSILSCWPAIFGIWLSPQSKVIQPERGGRVKLSSLYNFFIL